MSDSPEDIVDVLRGRVLRGLHSGTLMSGDRLPSGRELSAEFGADHRVVLAAYRQLANEGLVEMRERGGVYVLDRGTTSGGIPPLPASWFANILTQALAREIAAPELHEWLRRATETLRLRALVVATTRDQLDGLARELRDDFGLEADCLLPAEITADPLPLPLRRADLVVTTRTHADQLSKHATDLHKKVIVIELRPDLVTGEWAMLLRRPVYAVVATESFGSMLRQFFSKVPGVENLRIVVLGRDDVSQIPDDAPTYVTQSARGSLAGVRIPGRILPAARTISSRSAREIFDFIVSSNIEAMNRRTL